MGGRVSIENGKRNCRKIPQIAGEREKQMEKRNIYVEHGGEWYDYSHCGDQFPLDRLIEAAKAPDAGNVRTDKREFEIGALVYFEGVGWTEVVEGDFCPTRPEAFFVDGGGRTKQIKLIKGGASCKTRRFIKYTPDTTEKTEKPPATIEDLKHDPVSHPAHYTGKNGVECIQVTEQFNFNRGNAIKYIWRAGEKDPSKEIEDLKKAVWYIEREIKRIEEAGK